MFACVDVLRRELVNRKAIFYMQILQIDIIVYSPGMAYVEFSSEVDLVQALKRNKDYMGKKVNMKTPIYYWSFQKT